MQEAIRGWVQDNEQTLLDTLSDFVAFDTQNLAPDGKERAAQIALASLLRTFGLDVDIFEPTSVPGLAEHPQYWTARPCTDRPNVVGIRRGVGGGQSLIFSSHMDTVPVGPDPWTKQPWGGEVSEGKLWGLGAFDMKAGLVASVMAVKALNDLAINTKGDLLIESVVDEEFGGANGTLAARLKYNADAAIVAEPTNMVICPAHHGGLMLRVSFFGKAGWGFSPEKPIDPTHAIARFIVGLNDWALERNTKTPIPDIYRDNPALPVLVNQLRAGDVSLPFFADRVPSQASLTVWIESFPGETQEEIVHDLAGYYRNLQQTDSVLAEFQPRFEPVRWLDGSEIPKDHPLVQTLASIYSDVLGESPTIQGAPFACDGHMFNLYSPTPMVLFGPRGGQPHSPDEFVEVDSFLRLVEIFTLTAVRWCGVSP